MYLVTVFFIGPKTKWSERIAADEIIAEHEVPWLWLARFKARAILDDLNSGRCAYAITKDGELIEQHPEPPDDDPPHSPSPSKAEVTTHIDVRGASDDLVSALPGILKRNNDALEAKIVAKIARRQYTP